MTSSPICSVGDISIVVLSSRRTTSLIMRSTRSGSTDPLAQRDLDRTHELIAVERRAAAVLLDDLQFAQLHALESGEPAAAIGADPPPAD